MSEDLEQRPDEEEIAPVEEEQDLAPPAVDPELETEARKYGWRPKEEFDKNPDGWVDAERFLTMPQTQVKIMRDTTRRLEKELKERDTRISRIEGMTKTAVERVREQERQRYEAQMQAIEAAKRSAAEVGDVERYDALSRQQQTIQPPPPVQEPVQQEQNEPPELSAYREQNPWMADPLAVRFGAQQIEDNPAVKYLPPLKQVQWVEKRIREFFPEHFQEQQPQPQQRMPKVDGGGIAGFQRRGKGPDDLPPEARKIGQEFVAEGIFKSLDDYAKDYFSQGV